MERLAEKRDGQNVIPLRQNGKIKWSICSAGLGNAPTKYLYGDHADRLAAYEETGLEPEEIKAITGLASENCAKTADAIDKLLQDDAELKSYRELGSIDRLRELVQADQLIGMTVYESNKRGFISTYEVISVHISKCSILVGWNLLDGVYSNLNGFEISALGKSIFLTREEAEAALRREQE